MELFHELTTYAAAPGQLPLVMEHHGRDMAGPEDRGRSLVGAWTSEFGRLSRMITLYGVDREAALRPPRDEELGQVRTERQLCRLERPLATAMPCGVVEFRTYTVAPGQRQAYLGRMLAHLHIRERHSQNIGVWTPVNGRLDQVLHLWSYSDVQDRMRARAAAFSDPEWRAYLATVYPLLTDMESTISNERGPTLQPRAPQGFAALVRQSSAQAPKASTLGSFMRAGSATR